MTGSRQYILLSCAVAALGGLLFGYDTAVIAGAIGFLQEHFALSAAMKGWAASCALLGCVLGVLVAGPCADQAGRKKTLLLAAALFLVSSVGMAAPERFDVLIAFRILCGVAVGIASITSPMYIAEIAPANIRGRLVSINQMMIVTGMLLIYFVNFAIARHGNHAWNVTTGWRWMFASGVLPSALFLGLTFFVPESPRWLAAHQQPADDVGETSGKSSAGPRFFSSGIVWVGISLAVLQQVTGINVFLYYAPEIFKGVGSGMDAALLETVVVGVVNLVFTLVAMRTVDRLGRRRLMIGGSAGMGACLIGMGIAAQLGSLSTWLLVWVLGYIACFALSVGPVTWVLLSELFPDAIRARALSAAGFSLWGANFAVSQTFPMMDENGPLVRMFHHAFPFYLYAAMCVALIAVVWKCVPETKARSLEEIAMPDLG